MKFIKHCEQSKKRKGRLPLHVPLFYLLVCTFLLTGVTCSRHISSANGSGSARAAKGVVTVSYENNTTVEMEQPSDPDNQTVIKEFSFSVSGSASEVAIRYNLVLKLDQALPDGVSISLYKNGDIDPVGMFAAAGNVQFTVPGAGVFEAGSQTADQYKMIFNGDYNHINTADKRTVSISVQAEQID